MWDLDNYPNGDFGFSWFFFYNNDVPGWTQDQLQAHGPLNTILHSTVKVLLL